MDNTVKSSSGRSIGTIIGLNFGGYTAYTVISNRAQFNAAVSDAITKAVSGVAMVDSVQVEDIKFSPEFETAVSERMKAEVGVQKRQQELADEKVVAEITVTKAQASADSRLAVAKADAEAIRVKGEAEADAIKARAAALAANGALVELTKAERWDGKLPTTVIPNGTVPFLDAAPKP